MPAALRADVGRARSEPAVTLAYSTPVPFERVALFTSIDAAAPAWAELEATAPCSPYQQAAWARSWCATVALARGWTPAIAVAFDVKNRPVALLPLVRSRGAPIARAEFIGGKDSNSNLVLFADPARWDVDAVRHLLLAAGRLAGVDLLVLRNWPEAWDSVPNPLRALPHQPSPSACYATQLLPDAEQWTAARLSKHARKLLRQKEAKLGAIGRVSHGLATNDGEAAALVSGYGRLKSERASITGVAPPSPAQLQFYQHAASERSNGVVELHGLWCADELVAVLGGTGHRGRFSGMVLAMASRTEVAHCSPGELLLKRVVDDLCGRGFQQFDLGIGEARYKRTFCPNAEPLFDTVLPVTVRGHIAALAFANYGRIKHRLKRSEWAVGTLRRLKAALYRRSASLDRDG